MEKTLPLINKILILQDRIKHLAFVEKAIQDYNKAVIEVDLFIKSNITKYWDYVLLYEKLQDLKTTHGLCFYIKASNFNYSKLLRFLSDLLFQKGLSIEEYIEFTPDNYNDQIYVNVEANTYADVIIKPDILEKIRNALIIRINLLNDLREYINSLPDSEFQS